MENNNPLSPPEEILAIAASPEEVGAVLNVLGTNQHLIKEFVSNLDVPEMITFCAWFIGNLEIQRPEITEHFNRAREVGRDVALKLNRDYVREKNATPGDDSQLLMVFPPAPCDPAQGSLLVN